jgi:5-methylcytosine-specific restriction enzyme subunit McrC
MAQTHLPATASIGRIPVRNLWLLMLYASDLTRVRGSFDAIVDEDINDIPELIARLLTNAVDRRLRRNFTRGYCHRERVVTRVRGRINILTTESRQLLSRGEVFCCYEELTVDTPRNRFVRAALDLMARLVRNNGLIRQCRALASTLGRAGVGGPRPSCAELRADQIGRNDTADRFMVALARLAFDLALPTENAGPTALAAPDREEAWVRRLFEKAILGFARIELEPLGWSVGGSIPLDWQFSSDSAGLATILPRMVTDIVLDAPNGARRLVIDTKFTSVLGYGRFGAASLKSGYLYQMYAYLRSQEGRSPRWDTAAGLFLHPAIGLLLHEHVMIQNHPITFATVDLGGLATTIRNELRRIIHADFWLQGGKSEQPNPSTSSLRGRDQSLMSRTTR